MQFTDIVNGEPRYRFQEFEKFGFWANNIIQRKEINLNMNVVL